MREIVGNLWDYFGRKYFVILITTNGQTKANGRAIMGRGCAAEARIKIVGVDRILGIHLKTHGNVLMLTDRGYGTFPVKHNFWEKADIALIKKSAEYLKKFCEYTDFYETTFILGRPGCGNGKLAWPEVKAVLEEVGLPDNVWIISKPLVS